MTKNKPIYHARNVNRWKSLGETSTFHRFTNPRRDKSVYFWSCDSYLLYIDQCSHRGGDVYMLLNIFSSKLLTYFIM